MLQYSWSFHSHRPVWAFFIKKPLFSPYGELVNYFINWQGNEENFLVEVIEKLREVMDKSKNYNKILGTVSIEFLNYTISYYAIGPYPYIKYYIIFK